MVDFKDLAKGKEEQWFTANERELLKKARQKKEEELAKKRAQEESAESERLKALHWMHCPKCGHEMTEQTLEGVMVDECTFCGGVYFDGGELGELLLKKLEESKGIFKRLFRM